ncbi:hypothetical protein BOX15_Mlig010158g1 [Macrostomum lignano]|uniref:NR LBD domain-containing protein n=1 Tax=Macrostomum lignano TaxID=282301 RepID=A0A267G1B2_9PLAT|nr:hypothetical protein BOX15_Mlig010158g1 [Macrostomum lignano]
MKREYILTEEEKLEKRKKIDQNKLIRTLESLQLLPKDLTPADLADRELLSDAELQDVKFILDAYAASEAVKLPERQGQRAVSFDDLINFAELSVVRVIELCKQLPEFLRLSPPDRVALMKGGALELILLRGVISFDPERARFLDSGDVESAEQDSMEGGDFLKAAGSSGYAFLQLARSLRVNLQCDRATLILLLVVCLFSADRPGLTPEGRDSAEEAQVRYSLVLDRLLRTRLPGQEARKIYPQLLTQLAELRNLEKDFSDLAALTDPRVVRPLMAELLDMQEGHDGKKGGQF